MQEKYALILSEFPLDLSSHHYYPKPIGIYKPKKFPRIIKFKSQVEVATPLPIYARPPTYYEWKHNAFRADFSMPSTPSIDKFSGTDYLIAYWLLRDVKRLDNLRR